MTVLEPGPGMGFFTLELARLVGESGRVVCVDVQAKMIEKLKTRLAKEGLSSRVDTRVAAADCMGLADLRGVVDFTLAFYVVHEFPDAARFFAEVAESSKPGATLLLAEPRGHVKPSRFEEQLQAAVRAGFKVTGRPAIRRSQTAVLEKDVGHPLM